MRSLVANVMEGETTFVQGDENNRALYDLFFLLKTIMHIPSGI
jgi:hypothetical protein